MFDMPPLDINYEGWLAMSILAEAIKSKEAQQGGEGLRAALQNTKIDFGTRTVTFLDNGDQATLLTYIGQINDSKPDLVDLVKRPRSDFPTH